MKKPTRMLFYFTAFLSCTIMAFSTGCASGGFKLTRKYAQFVNSQEIIIRIILYILTSIVFLITILVDMVIFNTVDFWEGKVSAGDYQFHKGDKTYLAHHEYLPDTHLRRSTIKVMDDKNNKQVQEVVLNETTAGEIEVFLDGKLRTKIHSISELPMASTYDADGKLVADQIIFLPPMVAARASGTLSF